MYIAAGKIKGTVGIVGCNNPKSRQDYGHVTLAKELIKNNILVVETGCAAIASGKAVSIASYFVASGVYTVLGIPPKIFGSKNIINLVTRDLKNVVKACFAVEPDPVEASKLISAHIENKRKALNLITWL